MSDLHPVLYASLALMPGLLWLYAFYRLDCHEPEPAALLLKTFVLGGFALVPAFYLEKLLLPWALGTPGEAVNVHSLATGPLVVACIGVIAPLEELLKFFAAWVSVGRHPEYDEPVDGVIYMAAAALGFSTAENLWYLSSLDAQTLAARGVFSCFLHASCSGLVGYWWSEVRFHKRRSVVLYSALAAAIFAHGLFDVVAFGSAKSAFFTLAVFLVILDLALMARIADALDESPFKPPEADESEAEQP